MNLTTLKSSNIKMAINNSPFSHLFKKANYYIKHLATKYKTINKIWSLSLANLQSQVKGVYFG